jgi:single-stranded DNA-binding protein
MLGLNQVVLAGNLVRDAEIFERKDGSKALRLRLAITRPAGDGQTETDFFDAVKFDMLPTPYTLSRLVKGAPVIIVGELRKKRSEGGAGDQVYVVVNRVVTPESRGSSGGQDTDSQKRGSKGERKAVVKDASDDQMNLEDDPFL